MPQARRSVRGRTRRRRTRWWLAGLLTSLSVLAASCAGWTTLARLNGSVGHVDAFAGLAGRPGAGRGQDLLVVGTDDREGVSPAELRRLHAGGQSCDCTDTMLLVHLSADRRHAAVVSIPRDSYVEIPAHRDKHTGREVPAGHGKINAAFGMGGPALAVNTVEQATGIRVDHYLQVNFLSFVSTVDALGGVTVCTPRPLVDPESGLDLAPGTHRLDGAEALRYVRARHVDGSSDLGRMSRQQQFVVQMARQAQGSGLMMDPPRLQRVVSAALRSLTADRGLTATDLVALASDLKDLRPQDITRQTVPLAAVDHPVPGWGSTVLWDTAAADRLFEDLRADRTPGTGSPSPSASASTSASASAPARSVSADVAPAARPSASTGTACDPGGGAA
ncbi:hypothetical protein BIV57_04995 [Mangrovactinospora gilvigrisea]|uniref:Cell envelope-related transcriptional attenuator domain-containing protein n=1 Tax=Mangrovactinospora gilvigrisea TaxID=1428644 RepID=A0A1J7BIW0_9ACTN|nr:LCP family protein [Mangrovactinospora gilvigrisea]OIV38611.1 hypothetical protein BIV57_04995 [Mangrovactinospora gilvigrisea]